MAGMSVVLADLSLDGGCDLRQGQGMKRFVIWYLPQATIFIWGIWFGSTIEPALAGPGIAFGALMLVAAYTGGANLVISLVSRLSAHRRQSGSDRESLAGAGGFLGDRTQQRQRIGVDKDLS